MAKTRATKIDIRGARSEDAEALACLFSDPNAYSQTLQLPFPGVDLWRKRLADRQPRSDESRDAA